MVCAELQGGLFADCQEWCFQSASSSNKSSNFLQYCRFANAQKSRFQASILSSTDSAVLLGGRSADVQEFCFQNCKTFRYGLSRNARCLLADCQKWRIVAAKRSDKSSTLLQEVRFANAQEPRFLGVKR